MTELTKEQQKLLQLYQRAAADFHLAFETYIRSNGILDERHSACRNAGFNPKDFMTEQQRHPITPSPEPVSPIAAGFDGAKGYRIPMHGEDFRVRLTRGKTPLNKHVDYDFKEHLLWFYPDNEPAKLLWCNENDQWFELSFNPTEKP